ncbi:MAG: hypothetical protein A3G09_03225 [Candidatus Moranbacteria bacterium RIFCSPLOWO2_12_FULL_48_12]|nr:MAG: hypothetical protein A3G09_03225 [Candidatus Moranbacteria bacterium RIFCSPLOWO2_12_FULL_48_12]
MNKTLFIVAIVGTAILSPVVGMGIGETRSLILGLAPDEAILQLSDKIDEQRITAEQVQAENDQKTGELQSVVADQQTQLAEQQRMIDEQAKANAESKKLMECQALQKNVSYCNEKKYKLSLDAFLKESKAENPPAMESDEVVAAMKRSWKRCQDFYQEYAANGCD